jgi:hypothetical protein
MNRQQIKALYYITYISNVPSIVERGILAHNVLQKMTEKNRINFSDISNSEVQEIRSGKKIPGTNKRLHDYANLYFDAHNPMLSSLRDKNSDICVLVISKSVLDIEDVIVTDRNAARECWFKSVEEALPLLSRDRIFARYWVHQDDLVEQYKHKGEKCAEVLVPQKILPKYIIGALVKNEKAQKKLIDISNIKVKIKKEVFF